MKQIVVGIDGSENAATAMRWAVDEADLHGADVEAVLAWSELDQYHLERSEHFDPDYGEDTARIALGSWVADASGPEAEVAQTVVCDGPVRALLEAGDAADLLVLGARGSGGFEGLLLGSVSDRVAQLANRPVAVVRTAAPVRGGRVVVGIDGSARSRDALRWAAAEALAREAILEIVHAWGLPMMTSPPVHAVIPNASTLEENGRAILDTAATDPALAGVTVNPHVVAGSPARALLERATSAGLLVVGTRGFGRVAGALLGSVSRQLLHHAPCPVVVI
ncbi:MAG TPA: universal stress protein [Acidimicrobiia bacterium]|nr:universal stress protein [Acidimicrobiia bacterium]